MPRPAGRIKIEKNEDENFQFFIQLAKFNSIFSDHENMKIYKFF